MAQLVKMIKQRQGDMSMEEYANKVGLRGATLSRYYNEEREIGLTAIRKLALYHADDPEMLRALSSYALGMDPTSSSN